MNEKLKTKFKELRDEAKIDCESIDNDLLGNGFNISTLRIKWLNRHYDWLEVLQEVEHSKKTKYFDVRFNIEETSDRQYENKELHREVESDKDYREYVKKHEYVAMIVDFCKNIVEALDKKSWEVKTSLDYLKYTQGH